MIQTMSFWSSDRDPVAAVNVLWDIGRALSELEGEGELVKEQTSFLEKLTKTLEAVNKAMKEDHVPQGLQDDITAIWKPLLETEVEIVSSMGLNEDEVKTENMESVTSRFYMKTVYYERFSSKITRLQTEVVIPLSNLHRSITTMLPQNLPRSWQTFKRWAVESKRHSDKRLVDQTKEWLEPASYVEEKYQAYTDNISSSDYEWFFPSKSTSIGTINFRRKALQYCGSPVFQEWEERRSQQGSSRSSEKIGVRRSISSMDLKPSRNLISDVLSPHCVGSF